MATPNDDTIDIELRSSEQIGGRCLILASLLRLHVVALTAPEDMAEVAFDTREWLRSENLWEAMTESEQTALHAPPADLAAGEPTDTAQLSASLATIAWALALQDDSLSDLSSQEQADLLGAIPEPWDSARPWLRSAALREEDEIVGFRELTDVLRWRLEAELARRGSRGREREDIEQAIREVMADAAAAGLLSSSGPRGERIDLTHVSSMDLEEIAVFLHLTNARLRTLNWVCGFGDDWDTVPLDV